MLTDTATYLHLVPGAAYSKDQAQTILIRADFALSDMEKLWGVLCEVNGAVGLTEGQRQHAANIAYGLTILAGTKAAPVIPMRSAAE